MGEKSIEEMDRDELKELARMLEEESKDSEAPLSFDLRMSTEDLRAALKAAAAGDPDPTGDTAPPPEGDGANASNSEEGGEDTDHGGEPPEDVPPYLLDVPPPFREAFQALECPHCGEVGSVRIDREDTRENGAPRVVCEACAGRSELGVMGDELMIRALEEPEAAPKVVPGCQRYRVKGHARYVVGGIVYQLADGSVVSEKTHNMAEVRRQGVPIEPIG